ncbi:MAG: PepSY domain-containing protein [Sphingomonadales bacterium]|nr:PepSY domain-containing protein [Sphingomonadales bacterium]
MRIHHETARVYKAVHGWIGISIGLALFIAFFAGAVGSFKAPIQRWTTPPAPVTATPIAQVPALVERVLAVYPEAAADYLIMLEPGPAHPGRMSWKLPPGSSPHGQGPVRAYADLAPDGSLHVTRTSPSPVGGQIVQLHLKMGLPFDETIAKPITGAVAAVYFLMLVSGVILLLPSMMNSLFARRVGGNIKRMWLDLHSGFGLFGLPFHFAISLTAVVFCWQGQIERVQAAVFGAMPAAAEQGVVPLEHPHPEKMLTPEQLLAALARQAPGFQPSAMLYTRDDEGRTRLLINGVDPRHAVRGPSSGAAEMDPFTGVIASASRLPGRQDGWEALETNLRALHFGNYGGLFVHWLYAALALGGCALVYSGNLLWIESRRIKARGNDPELPCQPRTSRILGALAIGVPLGCVSGIAITIAAAKPLTGRVEDLAAWHYWLFYGVFLLAVIWAQLRGPGRAGVELLRATALAIASIPGVSFLATILPFGWNHGIEGAAVDAVALVAALAFWMMGARALRRSCGKPFDSLWHVPPSRAHGHATHRGPPRQTAFPAAKEE